MNKPKVIVLDTFPVFLSYWENYAGSQISIQIKGWASEYMGKWPELLRKQQRDYSDLGEDWSSIAEEKVFPFLPDRLDLMIKAHSNLIENLTPIHEAALRVFGFSELDIQYVIYVGLGNGAGWLTAINGSQAILFGLEMIAECGWTDTDSIQGLISHEIGHAIHGILRKDPELNQQYGPWWKLYTEGFAQRCEHILMGRDSWHEGTGLNDADWLEWCIVNRCLLATKFLQAVRDNEETRPFFGSWFDIQGYRQCGYYLGHEVIRELERSSSLRSIASLNDIKSSIKPVLESFTTQNP